MDGQTRPEYTFALTLTSLHWQGARACAAVLAAMLMPMGTKLELSPVSQTERQ